jgi:hypothetical protein
MTRTWLMIGCLAALSLFGAAFSSNVPALVGVASPAMADDDGGDGGGGRGRAGGFGSGGGSDKAVKRSRCVGQLIARPPFFKTTCGRGQARASRRATAAALPGHAPREIIAAGLSDADIATLSADGYLVLDRRSLDAIDLVIAKLQVPDGMELEAARQQLSTLNANASVDFNHFYRPQATPCRGGDCSSHDLISWPPRAATCGPLPTIGMIDTGINLDHASLKDSNIEQLSLGSGKTSSDRRHGTAIAALLVGTEEGRAPGLLPGAGLIAVDPFRDVGGSDTRAEAYDLVLGVDLLVARMVAIINLSLAGPDNAILADAVARTVGRGVMLVAAAGNDGPRSKPLYPAAYDGVIAVTALDQRHVVYRRAVRGEHIDFAAPGVGIWAAASVSGWRRKTGTSFATPFVTAALALAMAQGKGARGALVMQALSRTAMDLGEPGHDPVFGWGLVQAAELCRLP